MDFRLKKLPRGRGGLNIGLAPGPYCGDPMPDDAVHIAEESFFFLEPSIVAIVGEYANYGHWGVTRILKQDWLRILDNWARLRDELVSTQPTTELSIVRQVPKNVVESFLGDPDRNRLGLSQMIRELDCWIRAHLEVSDQMFIAGI